MDEVNALLVDLKTKGVGQSAKRLISNKLESCRLASRAFNDFRQFYTWRARASTDRFAMIQEKGHVFILVPSDSPIGPVKGVRTCKWNF